jgi:hypothetical protein
MYVLLNIFEVIKKLKRCTNTVFWLAHFVELEHLVTVLKMPQKSKVIFYFFDNFVIHIPKDENWL